MSQESQLLKFFSTSMSDEMKRLAAPMKDCFGIDTFAYGHIDENGQFYEITNQPALSEVYIAEQFYKENPLYRHPSLFDGSKGFLSSEFVDPLYHVSKQEWTVRTGLGEKICFVRKNDKTVSLFGFLNSNNDAPVLSAYANHKEVLQKFCAYFDESWKKNQPKMESYSLFAQEVIGERFSKEALRLQKEVDEKKLAKFGMAIGAIASIPRFSEREKMCIAFLLRGATAPEIAMGLHISKRTVERHIDNIKGKIGCSKKSELLEKLGDFRELNLI